MYKVGLIGIVVPLFFIASTSLIAEENLQQKRFSSWTKVLQTKLRSSRSSSEVAAALVTGPARIAAFNLQALGKLYEKEDSRFRDLRFDFKGLEDAIGESKKWTDIIEANGPDASERIIKKQQKAQKALAKMLKTKKWVVRRGKSRLQTHKKFLANYDFGSYADDKAVALKALNRQLSKVDERDYDLSKLEEGNGLHELRREIRWFALEANALNGLLTFREDNDDCPSEFYAPLTENRRLMANKYARLNRNLDETAACEISRCLYLGVTDLIGKFGKLKDKVEEEFQGVGDEVPEEIQAQAQEKYDELIDFELIPHLRRQINQCM